MDEKDKKMFLEFCTGSDRVPVGGLMRLKVKIQSSGPDSDRLPTGLQISCSYIFVIQIKNHKISSLNINY